MKTPHQTIELFVDLYDTHDRNNIKDVMRLFVDGEVEYIGYNAKERGGYEWATSRSAVMDMIQMDWDNNWGTIHYDRNTLQVKQHGDTALFSICGNLTQHAFSTDYWRMIDRKILSMAQEHTDPKHKISRISEFCANRLDEDRNGEGYTVPLVLTGALVYEESWRIQCLHASMPRE